MAVKAAVSQVDKVAVSLVVKAAALVVKAVVLVAINRMSLAIYVCWAIKLPTERYINKNAIETISF